MKKITKVTHQTGASNDLAHLKLAAIQCVLNYMDDGNPLSVSLQKASKRAWPDLTGRYYSPRTLERWYYLYQNGGFEALLRVARSDAGKRRKISAKLGDFIISQAKLYPKVSLQVLIHEWKSKDLLPEGCKLPSDSQLYRFLRENQLGRRQRGPKNEATKRFEAREVNDLWMGDFSPGPFLETPEKPRGMKTHLCVLIDDHSRFIVGARYYERETTESLLHELRESVMRRGIPYKLYVDNGAAFVSQHTHEVCGNLQIRLIHAKPGHAWSKGKVERVIQTIQQQFESHLKIQEGGNRISLEELNQALTKWISTYHKRIHSVTKETPQERYRRALQAGKIRPVDTSDPEAVERLFYIRAERLVRNDMTFQLDNKQYEIDDLSLKCNRVQLLYNPYKITRIEVWSQGRFCGLARDLDEYFNSDWGH